MELVALMLFIFSTSGTPGSNNIMILSSGLNFGVKRSLPHVLGVNLGFPVMIIGVGVGLMTLFTQFPWLQRLLQLVGSLYLLYLAWKIATLTTLQQVEAKTRPITFLQAASFQWVNPKAWVMAVSAIVAFSGTESSVGWPLLMIAGAFFIFGLPCSLTWLVLGTWLKRFLSSPPHRMWFNRAMAMLLILSIIPMLSGLINETGSTMLSLGTR